jgi:hypothetical protein
MNHGLAVAVDGDDGTGCGLHVRAVVLQAIFQRLQLLAQGFAFLLQGIGLFLVLGVQRGIHGFGQACILVCSFSMRCASRLFGSRRSLGARWKACRSAWVTPGVAPAALGADSGGDACQLVLRQPFQQRGIGQIHARIAFREQVAADAAACGFVGVQPDEAHQRMPVGVDFALGQAFAQVRGMALPLRRIVERGFLRGVVVGDGKAINWSGSRHRRDSRPSGAARRSPASSGAAPPAA